MFIKKIFQLVAITKLYIFFYNYINYSHLQSVAGIGYNIGNRNIFFRKKSATAAQVHNFIFVPVQIAIA